MKSNKILCLLMMYKIVIQWLSESDRNGTNMYKHLYYVVYAMYVTSHYKLTEKTFIRHII